MRVTIVLLGDAAEALLLRAQLESLGAWVDLRPVGKPSHFAAAFDASADVAIICAHGDEAGLIFEELAPGIDSMHLPNNRISAEVLSGLAIAAPSVVISTACASGSSAFGSAFHALGAQLYIAPLDYPDGSAIPVLLNFAAYLVAQQNLHWAEAIERANILFSQDNRFAQFAA